MKANKFNLQSYTQKIMLRFRNETDKIYIEDKLGVTLHEGIRMIVLPSKYKTIKNGKDKLMIKDPLVNKYEQASAEWIELPEFEQTTLQAYYTVEIKVTKESYLKELSTILDQNITKQTKSLYYPKLIRKIDAAYEVKDIVNPKYTIHIISKGRPHCITAQKLKNINVPYKIIIEPNELEKYLEFHPRKDLVLLPFNDLNQGSIPARNWVWEYSKSNGEKWHWILDDNIFNFYRFNKNKKCYMRTGAGFRALEDFCERYENVAQGGFNYINFAPRDAKNPVFHLNTRVYSCILIRNDLEFRWRGKYNEDTDLSLRMMKDGLCTILCNAFLIDKATTQTCKGGNTEHVYIDGDERMNFAKSLQEQHPDVVRVVRKFNRWHHDVNYKVFQKNKLRIKKEFEKLEKGVNNYGMELIDLREKGSE